MSDLKTKKNDNDVIEFIESVVNTQRRSDAMQLLELFESATGMRPKMWGESIIGFGQYHYKSERSAQEGDWPLVAFSPRKANLTIYALPTIKNYDEYLRRLGRHKKSVACIYINKLSDVDAGVLADIIKDSAQEMMRLHNSAQSA